MMTSAAQQYQIILTLSVADLRMAARIQGLDTGGNKPELLERLRIHLGVPASVPATAEAVHERTKRTLEMIKEDLNSPIRENPSKE